ncbi:unnamed protein product [Symbiodinium microadriaticum]|nr:unnamed protein product [Symbiodinium microadriaticum]CAE7943875.1 unnamed protein product [Symbiodinium sp. KB8]
MLMMLASRARPGANEAHDALRLCRQCFEDGRSIIGFHICEAPSSSDEGWLLDDRQKARLFPNNRNHLAPAAPATRSTCYAQRLRARQKSPLGRLGFSIAALP